MLCPTTEKQIGICRRDEKTVMWPRAWNTSCSQCIYYLVLPVTSRRICTTSSRRLTMFVDMSADARSPNNLYTCYMGLITPDKRGSFVDCLPSHVAYLCALRRFRVPHRRLFRAIVDNRRSFERTDGRKYSRRSPRQTWGFRMLGKGQNDTGVKIVCMQNVLQKMYPKCLARLKHGDF